jgi:hypothetical protein
MKSVAPLPLATRDLFSEISPTLTPIAAALSAHFADGGSIADGVRLVGTLERALNQVPARINNRATAARGSCLPPEWQPSLADISYALERGMQHQAVEAEAEKFRNYWVAKTGAGATKRDWAATWRNWVINAMERSNVQASYGRQPAQRPQGNAYARIASRLRQSSG